MEILSYTFKEICNKTGYTSSAIRYYEKEFKLCIPRDTNGRRLFTKIEFDKLLFIKELQEQGYSNNQIKRILSEKNNSNSNNGAELETAATVYNASNNDASKISSLSDIISGDSIIHLIDNKLCEINNNISELNQNINGKERDLLISENMKLKMELKRKSYEIIELKENLRFFKGNKKGFFSKIFRK